MIGKPFKKGHKPWNKDRRIKKECGFCGKEYEVIFSRKDISHFCSRRCSSTFISRSLKLIPPSNKGQKMSIEQRKKISEAQKGEKGYWWKGGVSPVNKRLRLSVKFRLWREAIFARDDWICQICKIRGGKLHPHHIKFWSEYPELRFAIDNGITLCEICHRKVHKEKYVFSARI